MNALLGIVEERLVGFPVEADRAPHPTGRVLSAGHQLLVTAHRHVGPPPRAADGSPPVASWIVDSPLSLRATSDILLTSSP